ncbi:hypothetical protein QAD02_002349 [Eretmocerus hayati]|uniref:Uncharacterized protein n=1 Tax=Eretmocerus hayati TaxID=131215 RepID=A0ACC2NIV3_9HYME|nr:hypothetical protein QAD02_002349 [Eretmocerus hayati]
MFDQEFGRMFKDSTNAFISEFPSFFEKRLIYRAKFYNPKLFEKYRSEKNDSLKALLILIELVPQPASVVLSRSKKPASAGQTRSKKCLDIESQQSKDEDISMKKNKYEKRKLKQQTIPSQNFFLKYATCWPMGRIDFFVVAENAIFSRKDTTNVISAFDLLFKVFHVFNLDYPPQILFSYHFIESFIYKGKQYTDGIITSLYVNLRNIEKMPVVEDETDSDSSSDTSK